MTADRDRLALARELPDICPNLDGVVLEAALRAIVSARSEGRREAVEEIVQWLQVRSTLTSSPSERDAWKAAAQAIERGEPFQKQGNTNG